MGQWWGHHPWEFLKVHGTVMQPSPLGVFKNPWDSGGVITPVRFQKPMGQWWSLHPWNVSNTGNF